MNGNEKKGIRKQQETLRIFLPANEMETGMEHSQKLSRSKAEMKMGMEMGNRQKLATAENGNAVLKHL